MILAEFATDLETHKALCEDILTLTEDEGSSLRAEGTVRAPDSAPLRKKFLAELTHSLNKIREHRMTWLQLEPAVRQDHPEISELLRENQNLIMKILVLDRGNEQALLRKGLVPNKHVPSASRQRPHFVADLYRRNSHA